MIRHNRKATCLLGRGITNQLCRQSPRFQEVRFDSGPLQCGLDFTDHLQRMEQGKQKGDTQAQTAQAAVTVSKRSERTSSGTRHADVTHSLCSTQPS